MDDSIASSGYSFDIASVVMWQSKVMRLVSHLREIICDQTFVIPMKKIWVHDSSVYIFWFFFS